MIQAMDKMIACCGINCETCEARIATMKNDDLVAVFTTHSPSESVIATIARQLLEQ